MLPVDVAAGTFSLSTGLDLSDRNGSAITIASLQTLLGVWDVPSSGAPSPMPSGSRLATPSGQAAAASLMSSVGATAQQRGHRHRISDPITPERSTETLTRLTRDFSELTSSNGKRHFRRDAGEMGAVEAEFDPVIGGITRLTTSRAGVVQAVTEHSYVREARGYRLSKLITTTYAPDGTVRGSFVTRMDRPKGARR